MQLGCVLSVLRHTAHVLGKYHPERVTEQSRLLPHPVMAQPRIGAASWICQPARPLLK